MRTIPANGLGDRKAIDALRDQIALSINAANGFRDRTCLRLDAGPWDAYRAAHAARAKGDACAAHASGCGEAALAQVDRDARRNLDAAEES